MQTGNGIDLTSVYQLLAQVAQRVGSIEDRLDQHQAKLNELVAVCNRHAGTLEQLVTTAGERSRKIDDVVVGLRELRLTVNEYHQSVVGHGIELTRLDERVSRIEAHLQLDPITR